MNLLERFNLRKAQYDDAKRNQKDLDELMREIDDVKKEIDTARCNFNNVTDADSIDYYTYMLKAYQVKHDMLIKQLKSNFT
jgi:hypothetical protein